MTIDQESSDAIAKEIHSDKSPVGIDAKKTHVLILQKPIEIQDQLNHLKSRIDNSK